MYDGAAESEPLPSRHRVLMVTPTMPADRGNGLAMRAGFFLDAYARACDVDLVVAPLAGDSAVTEFARRRARRLERLETQGEDTHYKLLSALRDPTARLEAFRHYGRPSRAAFTAPLLPALRALVGGVHYDAVHIFRLYLAGLAALWLEPADVNAAARERGVRLILDCDENETLTHTRIAAIRRRRQNIVGADFMVAEAAAYDRFAEAWLPKFDHVLAASRLEARSFSRYGVEALPIPNIVAPLRRAVPRRPHIPTVLFVGTLNYEPNLDGVIWFMGRVFRRLQRSFGGRMRFIIVGRNPPPAIARLRSQPGIEVWDRIDDIGRCYAEADLAIAPIHAGGGTRIKIVEAAAHGVPVVTTRLGAEGTTFQNGVHMLMADSDVGFLRGCRLLLRNRRLARRLSGQALAKVTRDYAGSHWRRQVAALVSDRAR